VAIDRVNENFFKLLFIINTALLAAVVRTLALFDRELIANTVGFFQEQRATDTSQLPLSHDCDSVSENIRLVLI